MKRLLAALLVAAAVLTAAAPETVRATEEVVITQEDKPYLALGADLSAEEQHTALEHIRSLFRRTLGIFYFT